MDRVRSVEVVAGEAATGADAWEAATAGGRSGSNGWSMPTITPPSPETVLRTNSPTRHDS